MDPPLLENVLAETALGYAAGPEGAMLLLRLGGGNHAAEEIITRRFRSCAGRWIALPHVLRRET